MLTVLDAGDRHLLLDLGPDAGPVVGHEASGGPIDAADPASMAARVRDADGVVDALPAASTVLVSLAAGARLDDVRAHIGRLLADLARPHDDDPGRETRDPTAGDAGEARLVEIPVVYDGDDLADVAHLLGVSPRDVVSRHTEQTWRCAFLGFAPGFGYLEPEGETVAVPRRPQSRTAVPAGSVALADGYSAVYPRSTPGGWQLIGRTDAVLWDLAHPQPALLTAGTRVRFVEVTGGAR